MPVRKIQRKVTRSDAIVAAMPRPPEVAEAVAMPPRKIDKTVHDGGLFDGAKRHPVVIGIDGSARGPALTALSLEDLTFFSWVFKPKTTGVERLVEIRLFFIQKLNQIVLRSTSVEATCMEGYGFASQMAHTIGEAGAAVKLALAEAVGLRQPAGQPILLSPNGLKKFATSSGGNDIKKQQILLAIARKWDVDFMDDNMADSYVAARVAHSVVTGVTAHAYEHDVITKLEMPTTWPPQEQ